LNNEDAHIKCKHLLNVTWVSIRVAICAREHFVVDELTVVALLKLTISQILITGLLIKRDIFRGDANAHLLPDIIRYAPGISIEPFK